MIIADPPQILRYVEAPRSGYSDIGRHVTLRFVI
jgi:hypothetical protein